MYLPEIVALQYQFESKGIQMDANSGQRPGSYMAGLDTAESELWQLSMKVLSNFEPPGQP